MLNAREQVRENLIKLRKANKLTQMELSEKIGYSDKAISRWETGEVTPDVETLERLAGIYGVPITLFFESCDKDMMKRKKIRNLHMDKKLAVSLLSIVTMWYIAIIIFMQRVMLYEGRHWLIFIWMIPATFLVGILFNSKWGGKVLGYVLMSLFIWSLITAVYLQFIEYNMFLLFLSGIPIQIDIILWSYIKRSKKSDDGD